MRFKPFAPHGSFGRNNFLPVVPCGYLTPLPSLTLYQRVWYAEFIIATSRVTSPLFCLLKTTTFLSVWRRGRKRAAQRQISGAVAHLSGMMDGESGRISEAKSISTRLYLVLRLPHTNGRTWVILVGKFHVGALDLCQQSFHLLHARAWELRKGIAIREHHGRETRSQYA